MVKRNVSDIFSCESKTVLQVKLHYFQFFIYFQNYLLLPSEMSNPILLNFMNIFKMFRHQWHFPTYLSLKSAPHPLAICMYKFSFILNDPVVVNKYVCILNIRLPQSNQNNLKVPKNVMTSLLWWSLGNNTHIWQFCEVTVWLPTF
jgi:hypothetical protein